MIIIKFRTRLEKVPESAARKIYIFTPMGLSFERTRAAGARSSEKKIFKWWVSAEQHTFELNQYKNYFEKKEPTPPKPCWSANNKKVSLIPNESLSLCLTEDDIVEIIFNDTNDLRLNEYKHTSNRYFLSRNKSD